MYSKTTLGARTCFLIKYDVRNLLAGAALICAASFQKTEICFGEKKFFVATTLRNEGTISRELLVMLGKSLDMLARKKQLWRRVEKSIRWFVFGHEHALARYYYYGKICVLSTPFAWRCAREKDGFAVFAALIAHEAMHGFLARSGITNSRRRRVRVEHICDRVMTSVFEMEKLSDEAMVLRRELY